MDLNDKHQELCQLQVKIYDAILDIHKISARAYNLIDDPKPLKLCLDSITALDLIIPMIEKEQSMTKHLINIGEAQ